MLLRFGITVILILFPSLQVYSQAGQVIGLPEALQMALQKSPEFIAARNQFEVTGLEQKNAFASFLPSIDLTSSHGRQDVGAGNRPVSGATLALTENFYDNGESFKKYRIASLRLELSKLNYQKIKAQIIRSVVLGFYRYNIALNNLKFAEKNHQELERLAKLVTNQFQQGLKTRKDYLSFKTRAQRGQLGVFSAEQGVRTSRSDLLSLLGLSPIENIRFDENFKPVLPKGAIKTEFKAEELYEVRAFNIQKEISELEIELSKRRFWPELSLVGAISYGSSDYIDTGRTWADNDSTQWNVLLNLKFNLVDWGVRNRNIQVARLGQDSLQQGLRSSVFRAEKELESFRLDVSRAGDSYRLSKELQKMEEDTFRLLENDYRSGRATYLELTTGLANLLDAQNRGQEADFDQADLYLRWKYYRGTLDETTALE